MRLKFKINFALKNEWIGWFGENVIKLKLNTDQENLEKDFLDFLLKNLGIKPSNITFLKVEKQKRMVEIEVPDIAWELFLSIIEK